MEAVSDPWSDPKVAERILRSYRGWAVVGCSSDPSRASHGVSRYLLAQGYDVVPVNPNERLVHGRAAHADLRSVPPDRRAAIEVVDLFRRSDAVLPHVEEAIEIGAKAIWMQLGVWNLEAAERAAHAGLLVVMNRCPAIDHPVMIAGTDVIPLWAAVSRRMPERMIRPGAILSAGLLLAACGQVIATGAPADAPGAIGFQDCEPPFVFDGDSTIAALGIDAEGLTHERTMPGHIRITRDTVTHEEFAPPGAPVFIEEGQVLCIEWAGENSGGMAMMLAEPWAPPGVLDPSAAAGPAPLALLAMIAVLLIAGVISWLAFGRERSPAS